MLGLSRTKYARTNCHIDISSLATVPLQAIEPFTATSRQEANAVLGRRLSLVWKIPSSGTPPNVLTSAKVRLGSSSVSTAVTSVRLSITWGCDLGCDVQQRGGQVRTNSVLGRVSTPRNASMLAHEPGQASPSCWLFAVGHFKSPILQTEHLKMEQVGGLPSHTPSP